MNFSTEKNGLIDNGIYCCVLKKNWNKMCMTLCVHYNGRFYDQFVFEDEDVPISEWDITDYVKMHSFTGKTYEMRNM